MSIVTATIISYFIIAIAYTIIGCSILAFIDRDKQLLNWAKSFPIEGLGVPLVIMAWPIILYFYIKNK